jgi:cell division protein FtsL
MTNRRRNHAQAAVINRRSKGSTGASLSSLRLVPRSVASAAGQQMSSIRPNLLRYIDLHPAMAVLTAAAIIAAVCVIYLSQVTAVTNANYTLQALQSQHIELQRQHDDLQLQIGKAQSETAIEARARNVLKMVPLDNHYSYLPIMPGPLASLPPSPTPGP